MSFEFWHYPKMLIRKFQKYRTLNPKHLFQQHLIKASSLLFALGLGLSLALAACNLTSPTSSTGSSPIPESQNQVLRIGYQKWSTVLLLLKDRSILEKRLEPEGISVEWNEFVAGPQMMEALNVGSIDFAHAGETPPIFAQAAEAPLVYTAYEPRGPAEEAILVQQDSPIQRVADLKGKKVAFNKGSNVHYLLIRALEEAGLSYSDIQPAYLPPGDARAAFEQGSVDAWVIWDPYYAAAEQSSNARILVDGQSLVKNWGFFLSTQTFAQEKPELVQAVLEELEEISSWAADHPPEVAEFLSSQLGIDTEALMRAEQRRGYGVLELSEQIVADQQTIADTFFRLKLIPKEIKVAGAIWSGA